VEWRSSSAILGLTVDGGEWPASRLGRITSKERASDTLRIGGCMGPRAGLDAVEKREISCPFWEPNLGCLARSSSLYGLSCPGWPLFYIQACYFIGRLFPCPLIRKCTTQTILSRQQHTAILKAFCELCSSHTSPEVETLISGECGRVNEHKNDFHFVDRVECKCLQFWWGQLWLALEIANSRLMHWDWITHLSKVSGWFLRLRAGWSGCDSRYSY
jgi:hypothetical protein